jgi:transposase
MHSPSGLVPLAAYLSLQQELERTQLLLQQALKRIEELEGRINKNSSNSSKPPTSDGLGKRIKNNRPKSNRPPGGQPGHPGSCLKVVATPDDVIHCKVEAVQCACGFSVEKIQSSGVEKRQVLDLSEVLVKAVDYLIEVKVCPCGKIHKGVCPYTGRIQYGKKLKALLAYLNVYQLLPVERVQEFCKDLFGISIGAVKAKPNGCIVVPMSALPCLAFMVNAGMKE